MIVITEVAESGFALPGTITKSDLKAPQKPLHTILL